MSKNYHAVLGVPPTAGPEAINEAVMRLAKKYYTSAESDPQALAHWQEIAEAWQALSNPTHSVPSIPSPQITHRHENITRAVAEFTPTPQVILGNQAALAQWNPTTQMPMTLMLIEFSILTLATIAFLSELTPLIWVSAILIGAGLAYFSLQRSIRLNQFTWPSIGSVVIASVFIFTIALSLVARTFSAQTFSAQTAASSPIAMAAAPAPTLTDTPITSTPTEGATPLAVAMAMAAPTEPLVIVQSTAAKPNLIKPPLIVMPTRVPTSLAQPTAQPTQTISTGFKYPAPKLLTPENSIGYHCSHPLTFSWILPSINGDKLAGNEWFVLESKARGRDNWFGIAPRKQEQTATLFPDRGNGSCDASWWNAEGVYEWRVRVISSDTQQDLSPASQTFVVSYSR